jgi:hypothetical protein
MDKNRLFGGRVNEMLPKLLEDKARLDTEARVERERKKIEEERKAPFKAVTSRAWQMASPMQYLVSSGVEVQYGKSREFRKKVIVVMGKHRVTEATPDHTVLCGLTQIEQADRNQKDPLFTAKPEFAFAIVPTEMVEHFVLDPHDLHNPNHGNVIRFDPEVGYSAANVEKAANDVAYNNDTVIRESALRGAIAILDQSQANLHMLAEFLYSPELNSHLLSPQHEITDKFSVRISDYKYR